MRVAVLGGGQVGRAVVAAAPEYHQVVLRTHDDLDIVDAEAVSRALADINPDWIVNAAAYTSVDLAEDQSVIAFAVNERAVASLVQIAITRGCRVLHLSSDFVFDGTSCRAYVPGDRPNPLGVYGLSKLQGERHVVGGGVSGIVLRTSWVYASAGRNFVLTMLRLMREKERIAVVCDQIGAPTWAASVAHAIWGLIEAPGTMGIYHWSDSGVASWYDFAVAIHDEALALGILRQAISIEPIPTTAYPTRARRPAFSLLNSAQTSSAIKIVPAHWRHNLRLMLNEIRAA